MTLIVGLTPGHRGCDDREPVAVSSPFLDDRVVTLRVPKCVRELDGGCPYCHMAL